MSDEVEHQPDMRGEPVEQGGTAGQTAPTPAEGIFEVQDYRELTFG